MDHALIVDSHVNASAALRELVVAGGLTVAVAHTLRDAHKQISLQPPCLVFLDAELPDGDGMDLLAHQQLAEQATIVLTTRHENLTASTSSLDQGAAARLVKPITAQQLQSVLSRFDTPGTMRAAATVTTAPSAAQGTSSLTVPALALASDVPSHVSLGDVTTLGHLRGNSKPMQRVYQHISRVATTGITVFITGESGSGKEVVAQTVHDLSHRRKQPFLAVNCGAVSPQLIESEIFGHERGSFTGADRQHQGFFERANGGTLFLDEITEMPLALQVKLLRVLETGQFMRVGGAQNQSTDVRVIAATNRLPEQAVACGTLREDLYYRLNVFPIGLPPLRDRLSDVPLLANHFLTQIGEQEGRPKRFSNEALAQLGRYAWPGNVRELRNAIQRAYVMADDAVIDDQYLPNVALDSASSDQADSVTLKVGMSMAQMEKALILATLRHCDFQKERTAAMLGISLKTLYNRLKSYSAVFTEAAPI